MESVWLCEVNWQWNIRSCTCFLQGPSYQLCWIAGIPL